MTTAPPVSIAVRARGAVTALFFVNGFLFASVVPRYPDIKAELDLSHAALGTAIAAMPLGALVVGLAASPLIKRFGSARTAVACLALMGVSVVLIGTAPGYALLCAAMFVTGSLDAFTDTAMNAHGLRVQKRYGRSILNAFHGWWSVGAVVGGILGAGAAEARIPLPVQVTVCGALGAVVALGASRFLLKGPEDAEAVEVAATAAAGQAPGAGVRRPASAAIRLMAVLGLLSAAAAVIEDSGASWGAVYLRGELAAGAFAGGLAFAALQGMQTVGRLVGDRVVQRLGERDTARLGGTMALVGMGGALLWPSVPTTVIGFGLAGLGIATLIPAAMHAADNLPGLWPGAGISVVGFLLRVGFLVSPPLVGVVADAESIRLGLAIVPVAAVVVLLTSRALTGRGK